jgi:hypothetical protein
MTRILNAVLHYISDNIPAFPVSRVDKHPLCPNGFHDATINENQIHEWWQTWPNAMIGIPTGPRSGAWVSDEDVDVTKGIDGRETMARLEADHGSLPRTLTSITPRGGKHRLFRWTGLDIRNSVEKIGPGLDVRGAGGYFIAPPSVRADGAAYRWEDARVAIVEAPAWLSELALAASSDNTIRRPVLDLNSVNGSPRKSSSARDYVWARAALQRECDTLNTNAALNIAAFNLGQIVAGGELTEQEVIDALITGAEACGLDIAYGSPSVKKTINSGLHAGMKKPRQRPR